MFNEMLARLREAVPEMILQVGGSISFAPEAKERKQNGSTTTRVICLPNLIQDPIGKLSPSIPIK